MKALERPVRRGVLGQVVDDQLRLHWKTPLSSLGSWLGHRRSGKLTFLRRTLQECYRCEIQEGPASGMSSGRPSKVLGKG